MRLENTDKELFELCKNSIDTSLIKSKIKSLSEKLPVIIIKTAFFRIMYTGDLKEILEYENVYETDNFENIDYDCYLVSLELFAINRDKEIEAIWERLKPYIKGFYEPMAEEFARVSIEYTPKIISSSFKENRRYQISFVVLSGLNNAASLERMLVSFKNYTPPDNDIEVIVVINGSNDESVTIPAKILGAEYRLKVINLPQNLGIAGGFNEGIDVSEGKYICILQDDVTFSQQNWHRELAFYLDKHNEMGLIGGYSAYYVYRKKAGHFLDAPFITVGGDGAYWEFMRKNIVESDVALCMAFMFRNGISRFDEHFIPNGIEDIAFCLGIRKKGYKIFSTDVGINHNHGLESATRKPKKVNSEKIFNNPFINKEIQQFVQDNKGKKVCFYGGGDIAEELIERCDLSEVEIIGLIDRDSAKIGKKIGKYEIFSINDVKRLNIEVLAITLLNDKIVKQDLMDYLKAKNYEIKVISVFKDYALALNPTYPLSRAYHFKHFIENYGDIISDLPEDLNIKELKDLSYFEKNFKALPRDYNMVAS